MKTNHKYLSWAIFSFLLLLSLPAAAGVFTQVDSVVGMINEALKTVLFFDVLFFIPGVEAPFLVVWLIVGATYLTFNMGFINIRGFKHAIELVSGKWDSKKSKGEVSSFQALSTALSATVGLGNIAGVAIAISIGGPGATFWMIIAGFLGMSSKFVECSLAQLYREVRPDGHVMGGGMEYLSRGMTELGRPKLGRVLAIIFCWCCIGGAVGAGAAFQANQSLNAVSQTIPFLGDNRWVYGLAIGLCVGIVIIGGIKRIAQTAEKVVPLMCGIYVAACLFIIFSNFSLIPAAFGTIVSSAFSFEAGLGGFMGVLIAGFRRAAFSNEAGLGSAAIAHSAAKTTYPVSEGVVALLEPFIDTVVICTMTALVIIITGVYDNPEYADLIANGQGAALTSEAFRSAISWFPAVLSVAVVLFAYSTMISWSYYGERCWSYMFGEKTNLVFKVFFIFCVFVGSVSTPGNIIDFSDYLLLSMAIPNFIGLYFLGSKVKVAIEEYMAKVKSGELRKEIS